MRALLERRLQEAGLSFAAWTVLVFTNASPLTIEEVAQRQIAGHVVSGAAEARQGMNALVEAGLIAFTESDMVAQTQKGSALFKELGGKVKEITQTLFGDMPTADLEVTHKTLLEIARRANRLLSS